MWRVKKENLSKAELRKRGGISSTWLEKMDEMALLGNMPEDNQLSLFDDLSLETKEKNMKVKFLQDKPAEKSL